MQLRLVPLRNGCGRAAAKHTVALNKRNTAAIRQPLKQHFERLDGRMT